MATTQVAIEILYKSVTEARNETQRLKQDIDKLKQERIELQIDSYQAMQKLHDLRDAMTEARRTAEALEAALQINPDDLGVQTALRNTYREIRNIQIAQQEARRESDITAENLKQNSVRQQQAQLDLKNATQSLTDAEKNYTSAVKDNEAEEKRQKELRDANNRAYKAMFDEEARAAEQAAQRQREAFEAFNRELEQTEQNAQRLASVFNTIGTVSGWTSDFANSIGNAFSGMSGLFQTDIGTWATASLTHQLTQKLVASVSDVATRYDILSTFVPYMELSGVDASTATALQERINQSILGLPIGLDEATQRFRRYQMFTGDAESAANLTIGIQNAIMAGGAGESYQTQAYNMIERILSTGDLTNIRQWQALMVGLGVSQRFVEEELGIERGGLMDAIRNDTITVDEFLGALERLGEGTSSAAQKMQSALDIYKGTIQSWLSNIEFAVTRGNANVLSAIDETLEKLTGTGITGYLEKWRDTENNIFGWASDYIRNNPEQMQSLIDSGRRLFEAFSRFSATDFLEFAVDNIATLVDMITTLVDALPDGFLEEFSAFATTIAGTVGTVFAKSGAAPMMMAVFERFKDFDWSGFAEDLASAAKSMASILSSVLNLVSDPVMSKILAYGLIFGQPVSNVMSGLGNAVMSGVGVWNQFRMANYLKGQSGSMGGYSMADIAAMEGGSPASAFWTGAFGGTLASAGMLVGPAALIANLSNWYNSRSTEAQAASYNGTNAELDAEIARIENQIANAYDENGYLTENLESLTVRLNALRQVRASRTAAEAASRKRITEATAGQAAKFEQFETAGKYDYSSVPDTVTESVNDLANSYWVLEAAARESISTQITLWGVASESVEGSAETLDEIVNRLAADTASKAEYIAAVGQLMNYMTPENAEYIHSLTESGIENLGQIEYVLGELEKNPDALDGIVSGMEDATQATDAMNAVLDYLDKHLSELSSGAVTKGQLLGQMLAEGIDAGSAEAARAAWRLAYGVQAAFDSIHIGSTITQALSGNASEFEWLERAYSSGGIVYASSGKFIPRGTDTVPAMLTPGEFVMRKQAVDTFGAAFMKHINDLNIGAAFDRLINTKLANPRNGFVSNTYNNRDDHSTHNQYVKTNNPAFAMKRAGRFVRAMA